MGIALLYCTYPWWKENIAKKKVLNAVKLKIIFCGIKDMHLNQRKVTMQIRCTSCTFMGKGWRWIAIRCCLFEIYNLQKKNK